MIKLPDRAPAHISETKSYKIFSRNIPDHWIIREVSEKDYGIDCYIELVTKNNQVTGDLISIQLKGISSVKWTKSDDYTISGIKISTTNYWMNFPTPVFICLVDVDSEEVFFTPVKSTVRKYYYRYIEQKIFSYKINKKNIMSIQLVDIFLSAYFREKYREKFEFNINLFLSSYYKYEEFIEENMGRDCFMGVDIDRILYLKGFFKNMEFLCLYFEIEWTLKSIDEYFDESQKVFDEYYDIHEGYLDLILGKLKGYLPCLVKKIRDYVSIDEKEYWEVKDLQLFNLVINIDDNGSMPRFI